MTTDARPPAALGRTALGAAAAALDTPNPPAGPPVAGDDQDARDDPTPEGDHAGTEPAP